jgi:flavin reductase (DIM6/NTAB) family NADH-FMN oxidoreductase RutF
VNREFSSVDPELQRQAMRCWTTGVTIVTSRLDEVQHGMTVNSFTSVSLAPPVVSVSLAEMTRTHKLVKQSGIFAITILEEGQTELADRFAGRGPTSDIHEVNRFEGVSTFSLLTGAPLLSEGLAHVDCKVIHTVKFGPTTVFFGEVVAVGMINAGRPMVYYNRLYRGLQL